jgi:hypothetical protein
MERFDALAESMAMAIGFPGDPISAAHTSLTFPCQVIRLLLLAHFSHFVPVDKIRYEIPAETDLKVRES